MGSLRDREVACLASDRQGTNFESCVWRTVSSQSSHHPQEVLLAQFSLYVHKGGLKPDSFHFIFVRALRVNSLAMLTTCCQFRSTWSSHCSKIISDQHYTCINPFSVEKGRIKIFLHDLWISTHFYLVWNSKTFTVLILFFKAGISQYSYLYN